MAQPEKRTVLLTPRFRVAFPQIETAMVFAQGSKKARPAGPGEKGRYSLMALFEPKSFSETDKLKWLAIKAALNETSIEAFKKPFMELDRGVYKTPFHKGEEKADYAGFGPGIVYCTLAAYTKRPGLVDGNNNRLEASDLYPGCYARASVNPYDYDNMGKGIALGVNNIQKLGDGDRLDGATSAEEDFGSDAAEFAEDEAVEEDVI